MRFSHSLQFKPITNSTFGKTRFFVDEFQLKWIRVFTLKVLDGVLPTINDYAAFDLVANDENKRVKTPLPSARQAHPSFLLAMFQLCLEIDQRALLSLQQKSSVLYPAKGSGVKEVEAMFAEKRSSLRRTAQALITHHVIVVSQLMVNSLGSAFLGENDWVHGADPSDVSDYARVRMVHIESFMS